MSFLKKPWIIAGIIAAIAVIIWLVSSGQDATKQVTFAVWRGNIIQEVSVTGRGESAESIDLAFEKGGKIARVSADVGDKVFSGQILVALENSELVAQLAEAEANQKAETAKLDELKLGSRPEEIQIQEAKVEDARQDLVDALQDAYTKSDDAVRNKVDQFFINIQSSAPKINFSSNNLSLQSDAEQMRAALVPVLAAWSKSLAGIFSDLENIKNYDSEGKKNLAQVRAFLETIALVLNNTDAGGQLTQAKLDSYRSDVSTARTSINNAVNALSSAEYNFLIQERQLVLDLAGATAEQLLAQEAKVEQAAAKVDGINAQIEKTLLRSPINGTVTKQDAKRGSITAANVILASVISESEFEIKVKIPEVDIVKVKLGNAAKITLDAYGNEIIFEAKVVSLDPAETIVEGVATYGATLQFLKKDERIRSGMTANIDILTAERNGVIIVPQRAVFTDQGDKFVRILKNNSEEDVRVETGLRGSDGNVEIISGVSEGDVVITSFE